MIDADFHPGTRRLVLSLSSHEAQTGAQIADGTTGCGSTPTRGNDSSS